MYAQIIYIGEINDTKWLKMLETATIKVNYSLEVISGFRTQYPKFGAEVALILIDAGQVQELSSTISKLHSEYTEIPIVILSAAPRWHEARDTILAGAIDYQLKPSNSNEILQLLVHSLKHNNKKYEQDKKHHLAS